MVVRDILVVGPYSGGDSQDYHNQGLVSRVLKPARDCVPGRDELLPARLLRDAGRAPAGGGYTRQLMKADPDRVIAGVVVGATMKL